MYACTPDMDRQLCCAECVYVCVHEREKGEGREREREEGEGGGEREREIWRTSVYKYICDCLLVKSSCVFYSTVIAEASLVWAIFLDSIRLISVCY